MTERVTLARPYAVAAFRHAKKKKSVARWSEGLATLAALMEDPRLQQAAANPRVRREAFAAAFLALLGDECPKDQQNFVRLLIENRRLDLLPSILQLFNDARAADEGQIPVTLKSAFDLTDAQQKQITKVLQQHLGKKPLIQATTDPALIGGLLIRAGDRVIDASIRGQIERLTQALRN